MTHLVKEDQPQYKALAHGFSYLSTSELFCLITGQGTKAEHINITRDLLSTVGNNINELGKLSINDLVKFKGIGKTKALAIGAAFEFSRRSTMTAALSKTVVRSANDIAQYFRARIGTDQVESFAVAFLNRANKINHIEIISFVDE